jgi:malate/lactate dehydrogenase
VAIVDTGFVVSTTACALLMSGTPAEIVLIDRDLGAPKAVLMT